MLSFWNKDMRSQNKVENIKEWIGGEYYIQTSLFNVLTKMENCKVIKIDEVNSEKLLSYFTYADIIIVPGWHHQLPRTHKFYDLFVEFNEKMFSYVFFQYTNKEYLEDKKFITPWKYTYVNNFIPITPIQLPPTNNYHPFFENYTENGLIHGKCISHILHKNKIDNFNTFINGLKHKVFTVLRSLEFNEIPSYINKDSYMKYNEQIINNDNINNLGILNPIDFRLLLRKIKYIVFFHTAFAQPTIIEALYEKCIILSTQSCIPQDLLSNKNIYLIDNLNQNQIDELISDIENNKIIYSDNEFPSNYTIENKIRCINNLSVI
jgi:hypothetical protein